MVRLKAKLLFLHYCYGTFKPAGKAAPSSALNLCPGPSGGRTFCLRAHHCKHRQMSEQVAMLGLFKIAVSFLREV